MTDLYFTSKLEKLLKQPYFDFEHFCEYVVQKYFRKNTECQIDIFKLHLL